MTSPNLTVDLIRHVESTMNVAMANPEAVPFIGGRENHVDISDRGILQAKSLGNFAITNEIQPTALYCSPALRSRRTCQISAEIIGLTLPITVDDRLQELDQGDWTNKPRSTYDIPANKLAMAEAGSNFAPPNGQSINDVADQMDSFFKSISDTASTETSPHVWVHTHGVAIKSWLGRLCSWSHDQTYKTVIDNASISRVVSENGLWRPVFINKPTN